MRQDLMEGCRKSGSKARIYKGSALTENSEEIGNRLRSRKRIDAGVGKRGLTYRKIELKF